VGRKALRRRHKNGVEVRKKEAWGVQERGPGGSSEPPEPPICCSLADALDPAGLLVRKAVDAGVRVAVLATEGVVRLRPVGDQNLLITL
jgi:hypothetical protein